MIGFLKIVRVQAFKITKKSSCFKLGPLVKLQTIQNGKRKTRKEKVCVILSFSAGARNIERECSSISLSFCSFLYNGVCFDGLNLSIVVSIEFFHHLCVIPNQYQFAI